jgi:hypothetical protein
MTYRRFPNRIAAARAWDRFVSANAPIIAASGIPTAYLASIDHFDDFLMHGCLANHPDDTDFQIEDMSTDQYATLVLLVESYFAEGYEWSTPLALRPEEQHRLASRFGAPGAG